MNEIKSFGEKSINMEKLKAGIRIWISSQIEPESVRSEIRFDSRRFAVQLRNLVRFGIGFRFNYI